MGVRVGVLSCWTMLVQQYLFGYRMFFFWPLLWTDMFALLITVYIVFVLHMFLKQRQQAPAAIRCAVWVSCCYLQVWRPELWQEHMVCDWIVVSLFWTLTNWSLGHPASSVFAHPCMLISHHRFDNCWFYCDIYNYLGVGSTLQCPACFFW